MSIAPQTKQVANPTLSDIMALLKEDIFKTLNAVQVGTIESFNPETQTASVQVSIKRVVTEDDQGNRVLSDVPLLPSVPVFQYSGGSSYLTMPIAVGDTCIVLFNDRELDNWYLDGGRPAPTSFRKHDLSDAICLVGVRNLQNVIGDFLSNGVRLKYDDNTKIDLTASNITASAGATELTATETNLDVTTTTVNITAPNVSVSGITTSGQLISQNGWTGTFATGDSRTVTVVSGIITSVA